MITPSFIIIILAFVTSIINAFFSFHIWNHVTNHQRQTRLIQKEKDTSETSQNFPIRIESEREINYLSFPSDSEEGKKISNELRDRGNIIKNLSKINVVKIKEIIEIIQEQIKEKQQEESILSQQGNGEIESMKAKKLAQIIEQRTWLEKRKECYVQIVLTLEQQIKVENTSQRAAERIKKYFS